MSVVTASEIQGPWLLMLVTWELGGYSKSGILRRDLLLVLEIMPLCNKCQLKVSRPEGLATSNKYYYYDLYKGALNYNKGGRVGPPQTTETLPTQGHNHGLQFYAKLLNAWDIVLNYCEIIIINKRQIFQYRVLQEYEERIILNICHTK